MKTKNNDYFGPEELLLITVGTQLQIEIEGVSSRFKSTLIGMVFNKCLIMDAPFANTIKTKLFQGNKIVVRFMYEGTVFGFESELIKDISNPIKALFVSYPKIIARHELRSQKRIGSFLPSELMIKNKMHRGVILDINERGCRCLIKASGGEKLPGITLEGDLVITFHLPGIEDKMAISGIVKNLQRDDQELHLGIKFDKIPHLVQNKISQYVSSVEAF